MGGREKIKKKKKDRKKERKREKRMKGGREKNDFFVVYSCVTW